MAKRGRPSKYTPELANEICERLAKGESLRSICRDAHMPDESAVRLWDHNNVEGFSPHYAKARASGMDKMVDDILDIADDVTVPSDHKRLMIDTRKWIASKFAPKRFGDKVTVGGEGPQGEIVYKWQS